MKLMLQIILLLFFVSACASDNNTQSPIEPPTEPPTMPPVQKDDTVYAKPTNYDVVASNIDSLKSELAVASEGDVIALADGTYSNVELDIARSGIVLVAENSGAVFIEGESSIELSGDDIIFEGFTFQNGQPADSKGQS